MTGSRNNFFSNNSFIISESRNAGYPGDQYIDRFLVSVGLLRFFKYKGFSKKGNMFLKGKYHGVFDSFS